MTMNDSRTDETGQRQFRACHSLCMYEVIQHKVVIESELPFMSLL